MSHPNYPDPPQTVQQALADHLAGRAGYVVITRGTRAFYEIEAEEILELIARWYEDRGT